MAGKRIKISQCQEDIEAPGIVLGFDTGLNAKAFAQAKLAHLITECGLIVYPDGRIEKWQPGGSTERYTKTGGTKSTESIVIWGPLFPGEELTEIISGQKRKDEALDALRFWLKARIFIENHPDINKNFLFKGPVGALIVSQPVKDSYPMGTVFFPPARLIKRTLEAEGSVFQATRWAHPDLGGSEEISFSAAVMLYCIFCGHHPFPLDDQDEFGQDIREAVFTPPKLAAPGLDPQMAELINSALRCSYNDSKIKLEFSPEMIIDFLGSPGSKPVSFWLKELNDAEIAQVQSKREQYIRKKNFAVKTRRYVKRNATVFIISFAVILLVLLISSQIINQQTILPNTKGKTPIEVVKTYYKAFDILDHSLMRACVHRNSNRVRQGQRNNIREDIQMATNLFIISRIRQSQETVDFSLPVREWLEAGKPETHKFVFGITDLQINVISTNNRNAILEAVYTLWLSGAGADEGGPVLPAATHRKDRLELVFHREMWLITNIEREES